MPKDTGDGDAERLARADVDLKGKPIILPWGGDAADHLVEKMRRAGGIARSADQELMAQIIRNEIRARDAALRETEATAACYRNSFRALCAVLDIPSRPLDWDRIRAQAEEKLSAAREAREEGTGTELERWAEQLVTERRRAEKKGAIAQRAKIVSLIERHIAESRAQADKRVAAFFALLRDEIAGGDHERPRSELRAGEHMTAPTDSAGRGRGDG